MALLKEWLGRELRTLLSNDIRFRVVGRMDGLDPSVVRELEKALDATGHCGGMVFSIALNYSGRAELADAMRSLAADVAAGRLSPGRIDEAVVASRLYTAGLPDPDLLIRTSGEMRVSTLSPLADRVRRDPRHAGPLARFPRTALPRGDRRVPEAGAAVRWRPAAGLGRGARLRPAGGGVAVTRGPSGEPA